MNPATSGRRFNLSHVPNASLQLDQTVHCTQTDRSSRPAAQPLRPMSWQTARVMAGENLAPQFMELPGNRWEWKMNRPVSDLKKGTLTIIARDRSGNVNRIVRTLSVGNRGTP